MSETCTHDCSSCGESCSSRKPDSLLQKPNSLSNIKKVIAVVSGKGGVGKSLVTSLLAVLTTRAGLRAGILDADVTGPSIPKAFGVTQKAVGSDAGIFPVRSRMGVDMISLNLLLENDTDPVVWRGPVISGAVSQFWTDVIWKDEDIVFIDMPPGTGDVPLTVFQTIPLDGVVIVSSPQELVGMIVEKAVKMADMMHVPVLGLVENMSYLKCPDCGKEIRPFGESHIEEIANRHGITSISRIPIDPSLAKVCDAGLVELFEGTWLDTLLEEILALPVKEK